MWCYVFEENNRLQNQPRDARDLYDLANGSHQWPPPQPVSELKAAGRRGSNVRLCIRGKWQVAATY